MNKNKKLIGKRLIRKKTIKRDPIWDLPNLAKRAKIEPMGWSADNEAIYDHNTNKEKFKVMKS